MRRLARHNPSSTISSIASRSFVASASPKAQAVTAQTTTATNPRPNDKPAATSTSAAQPFSTPETAAPKNLELPINTKRQSKAPLKIQSSVPAGTVLKGLNFLKNANDPVALDDAEYPDWLWTSLEKVQGDEKEGGKEGDLFCKCREYSDKW